MLEIEITRPHASAILGVTCDPSDGPGVRLSALAEGQVAAKAGSLFVGDTIVTVGGLPVNDPVECANALRASGERVVFEVVLSAAAHLAFEPPHVMGSILSVRRHHGAKQYLVLWQVSG